MTWVAIRMLTADKAKFFGLIFGVAFSAFLIAQQLTLYVNLLGRASSQINDTPSADVWVMDKATRTPELSVSLPITDLYRVRGVPGVAWAAPLMIANSVVRSPDGAVEGVTVVGVDDYAFVGLPQPLLKGRLEDLARPDSIFVDAAGARRLTPLVADPRGAELELNEQRAVLRGIVDANPTFTSGVLIYTRYSKALDYVPGTRNRMSFVLVRAQGNTDPAKLAAAIASATGLKARTREQFADDGKEFIFENTAVPINFATTVALGFIVGAAIVGLTFSLFIRDNLKQFAALKAIGVNNLRIQTMVAAQAGLVGFIGFGFGIVLAASFTAVGSEAVDQFKGFYTPWKIPVATGAAIMLMIVITALFSVRTVLNADPAEVFQ